MNTKMKLLVLSIIVVSLLSIGTAVMASGVLRPVDPSGTIEAVEPGDVVIAAHITLPPSTMEYKVFPLGSVEYPSDRPIAMLSDEVAIFTEKNSAYFSELNMSSAEQSDEIVFTIFSSIKYTLSEGDILITTTRPSDTAAAKSLYLGEREIKLANGMTAWATQYSHDEFANRVVYIDGDLIITVASDLPIDDVQNYAAKVVVLYP